MEDKQVPENGLAIKTLIHSLLYLHT